MLVSVATTLIITVTVMLRAQSVTMCVLEITPSHVEVTDVS